MSMILQRALVRTGAWVAAAIGTCGMALAGTVSTFGLPGQVEKYTVATTGTYHFEVAGASGGNGHYSYGRGGLGARFEGDVNLTAGEVLDIVVGGVGFYGSNGGGGGGGGSFVYIDGTSYFYEPVLLAAAGGGGGGGTSHYSYYSNGASASNTIGRLGNGGNGGGNYYYGGGGAGWNDRGYNGIPDGYYTGFGGYNSPSFTGGRAGYGGQGGFGGGGGGGYDSGGGGGGATGGNGGSYYDGGGAGGSYLASTFSNFDFVSYVSGNGQVVITAPDVAPAPEPATLAPALIAVAALAVAGARRRRAAA